jgi:hypothetical protein
MGKATERINGNHYITKRLTVHIGAEEILSYVLAVDAYKDSKARKDIEEQAAIDIITDYSYQPNVNKFSDDENKKQFLEHIEKALDFCIKKFPDIPSEEFKKEYSYYKCFLD